MHDAVPFDSAPHTGLVHAAFARLCASAEFARSPLHCALLRHLVTTELREPGASTKETLIAVEVFGRDPAQYDPRLHPVVRIEAGRLRKRLARFYAGSGRLEALRFEMRAAGYALRVVQTSAPASLRVAEHTALAGRVDGALALWPCANDATNRDIALPR